MSNGIALDVRNVSKIYGAFQAVADLSFSLETGSICGFLGPNGAGKTTTIRMILEIIRPTSGSITVLGQPSALMVRDRIGYLPEEKGLYKKMKAWATIAYFATLKGVGRFEAKRRARELLERYGLKDSMEKPIEALSKGMAQKVQMLSSIAHDPELVILDEPFSGLDPVNQQVMEEIIHDLANRGRTILFSTHVMQHAERLCNRIILLARGRKIFDGTIAEAKRSLPRRVRIETQDRIDSMRELKEVVSVSRVDDVSDGRAGIQPASEPGIRLRQGYGGQVLPGGLPSVDGDILGSGSDGLTGRQDAALTGRLEAYPTQPAIWELEIREQADAQVILQACFARGIRLRTFQLAEPSLHDVFVHLVSSHSAESSGKLGI